jgi:hypothetical protein
LRRFVKRLSSYGDCGRESNSVYVVSSAEPQPGHGRSPVGSEPAHRLNDNIHAPPVARRIGQFLSLLHERAVPADHGVKEQDGLVSAGSSLKERHLPPTGSSGPVTCLERCKGPVTSRRGHSPWRWSIGPGERQRLMEEVRQPGPNQGPTPPDFARPSQTPPDIRAALNCGDRT